MDDDLVAGLEIEPVRHQVVRLAGVAGDDDLVWRHAQEPGQRRARVLFLRVEPGPVVRRRVAIDALGFALERLEHRPGGGAEVRRVHHRQVWRHHELIANALPERLPRGSASGRERARGRRLPGPRRVAEECGRAAGGKQPSEVSS
jgi:hypothetical protein